METVELEVLRPEQDAMSIIQRAEIDTQIATAHRYPRSMTTFKARALEMATMDEETAASCIYCRPVGGGKFAEGLSIRTAEIVGAAYGNLRVGAQIVEQTERFVRARGYAHDLESNFASSSEVIESTIKKDKTPYDERMRVVIAKAALAKARRDATFMVVPKALCKFIETEAKRIAVGDAKTIGARRDSAMQWIAKLRIDPKRVWEALGIQGEEELGLEELATLTGLKTAIKDGEVAIDEAFPVDDKKPVFETAPKSPKAPTVTKAEPPPQATPLEGVLNLIKASGTTAAAVLAYVQNEGVKAESLSDLDNSVFANLKENWSLIIDDIKGFEGGAQ